MTALPEAAETFSSCCALVAVTGLCQHVVDRLLRLTELRSRRLSGGAADLGACGGAHEHRRRARYLVRRRLRGGLLEAAGVGPAGRGDWPGARRSARLCQGIARSARPLERPFIGPHRRTPHATPPLPLQETGFAIPAVNCISSSSINACLEAARKNDAPIMIQFSSGGSQFYAGARCGCRQAAVAGSPAPSPMGPAPCDAPCRSPEAWARAAPGLVVPPLVSGAPNAPRPPCHIVRGRACRAVGPTPRPVRCVQARASTTRTTARRSRAPCRARTTCARWPSSMACPSSCTRITAPRSCALSAADLPVSPPCAKKRCAGASPSRRAGPLDPTGAAEPTPLPSPSRY